MSSVIPTLPYVSGPDVSRWQDDNSTAQRIDFTRMLDQKAGFVGIKVSQSTWLDEDYIYNWDAAKRAGMPRMGYHFLDWNASGKAQARAHFGAIQKDPPELMSVADYEKRTDNPGRLKSLDTLWDYLAELDRLLDLLDNCRPIQSIYTSPGFWKEFGSPDPFWAAYRLWLANYGVLSPSVPAPWTKWTFWQWGTPAWGLDYGAESKDIDMNYFHGDAAAFRALFGIDPAGVVSDPNQPQPAPTRLKVAVKALNMRDQAGNGQRIGAQLFGPTQVEVLERQQIGTNTWAKVRVEGWCAEKWYGQDLMEDV